ncbi:hypothetical protein RXV94_05505 [Yeosuana sp. MJ-SS3]|uniref:Uncharacterized protein n=1 Tax=Gilvirhabdus luticola TaxID=3079858 RepID=A0ABU3U5G6_9FLAO|nr:hypothetical protein [Yeosuana sp. MJ-SS3]MDU8885606.1 hypothetical protein [Yeosuana sp. MJ-SS3]
MKLKTTKLGAITKTKEVITISTKEKISNNLAPYFSKRKPAGIDITLCAKNNENDKKPVILNLNRNFLLHLQ